ncbi:MAG: arginine deiminase, partial [Bacilli bacterium]|nr:arginine deiminase [Bacilli bacterium]
MVKVFSEIGKLKKVLLHRPGEELENLTPKYLDDLLFDDIPYLPLAQKEHDAYAEAFRKEGIEVVYLVDLVAEVLDISLDIKKEFISQFIKEAGVTSDTITGLLENYLLSFKDTKEMVLKIISGIKKKEVPGYEKRNLSDFVGDYPFVTDPIPNLYFTRDPFACIGSGVSLNKMYSITRRRETIFGEYIFKYHKDYKDTPLYYNRNELLNIEGGDILVLNDKVLMIGVSERTHPMAIEKLCKNIFYKNETSFEMVLAITLPKMRTFMHLDTIFTQVDYDKFTIH